ncbi:hypothetical protein [Halobellus ordinarius]|uniref:hypothetical protein n=1 Tax=Halobellus ordinarius TaxID=3075120 RepID=UPI002880310F|nr:hypothetical protein [Halobellus sp. ZY16]
MNEESAPATDRGRMTRRGVLALAGTSVLAGCSGLAGLGDEQEPTIRASDLPDIDPDEDPDPAIPESVPVDIAPDHFDAARNRVTTLLAELPTPLGPGDIPNGYIRQQLSDAATDATTGLDDARNAPTGLVALESLRRARAEARYAAAGWAVADRDLSVEPIQQEYRQTVSDAKSVRDAHEYVGSDPVRAALVHARIENTLQRVIDSREPATEENGLLYVAEWGETAESAQAHLDDARHLDEQFTTSLPADAGTVEETLTEAAETLLADVRSRRSGLPSEPTAEEWDIPEQVIGDLRREADGGVARVADANGPAGAVIDAHRRLTQFQALDRLQERVDDGELSRPQSAEAVREIRSTAYDALNAAIEESSAPDLTRTALTSAAWRVVSADWELARYEGEIAVSRLDTTIAEYTIATAIGRAAPGISKQAVETLMSA